ncbi:gfo/Idh/MocA family oxidoreductase [Clostridium sp. MCC353]|uniref:Gfo/Idh/MocA family protein n=1 Tax=Clostridium sp. MCC353 TaxID=2592646 RepID=UPI001C024F66|nr:Gfo/Idh/MocA family oxidoreductase [Clostridium sp. MCC353]MBT9778768.1 gfo/Idh/MocA family oxidoreductase [Clostridium sp. MCC353]
MTGVAIIGAGDIANTHIEAYLKFKDRCQIVMLVDRLEEKAREKAEKYGLDCEVSSDYMDIAKRSDISLVSVCLPPALHCQVSSDLLRAGKNVLCEKPMAPTLEECDKMLDAEKAGGGKLSIVAQNRFKPDVMKTKEMLDRNLFGKIYTAFISSLWWRGSHYYDLCWRGTWEREGGGCTFSHGVHHLDLFLWFLGDVDRIVSTLANQNHLNSEVEDFSIHTVYFKNNAVGLAVSSLLHHGEEQKIVIDAEKGTIELPHKISVSRQLDNGYPEPDDEKKAELEALFGEMDSPVYSGHEGQIEDMLSSIENGLPPFVTGAEGRRTVEFITGAYQSAFTGQAVKFPMTERDLFYTKKGIMSKVVKFHEKTVSVESFKDIGISVGGTL